MPKAKRDFVGILKAVPGEWRVCALMVLVAEAIFAVLAARASGTNFTLLVIGMLVLFAGLIIAMIIKWRHPTTTEDTPPHFFKHDVFISAPMAGCDSNREYRRMREAVLKIVVVLETECRFKSVYFAGKHVTSLDDFHAADVSMMEDYEALQQSRYFLLIYPKKVLSSVLVEAGWAMAMGKPSVYLFRNREDLPFLLQQAHQANVSVRFQKYESVENILRLLEINRERLFTAAIR